MGDKFSKATGLSLAAFVALIVGLQWESFFKALSGFPALVQAWSTGLPFGVWSFMLALSLGMGMWGLALMYAPNLRGGRRPHAFADTMALVVGISVVLAQQWGGRPGQLLSALWVGLLAGLLSLYLARLLWSFFATPKSPKE